MAELIFPTFNVSPGDAVIIVKSRLDDENIPIPTKVLAIQRVAEMETHNSVTKEEIVGALRWLYRNFDFDGEGGGGRCSL